MPVTDYRETCGVVKFEFPSLAAVKDVETIRRTWDEFRRAHRQRVQLDDGFVSGATARFAAHYDAHGASYNDYNRKAVDVGELLGAIGSAENVVVTHSEPGDGIPAVRRRNGGSGQAESAAGLETIEVPRDVWLDCIDAARRVMATQPHIARGSRVVHSSGEVGTVRAIRSRPGRTTEVVVDLDSGRRPTSSGALHTTLDQLTAI